MRLVSAIEIITSTVQLLWNFITRFQRLVDQKYPPR